MADTYVPAMFDDWESVPFHQVDWDRLCKERRAKVLAAMKKRDIDGLITMSQTAGDYISGAADLHVFGGGIGRTVYFPADGQVWTTVIVPDWIPADIPDDHLLEFPWDVNLIRQHVQQAFGSIAVKGAKIAVVLNQRQGWDVLNEVLRGATIVAGDELIEEAMMTKTQDELLLLKHSLAITEAAFYDVVRALRPGVREVQLMGIYHKRAGDLGSSAAETEGTFCVTPRFKDPRLVHFQGAPYNRLTTVERSLEEGDLVCLSAGARYIPGDYNAELGRTWYCTYETKPPPAALDLYKEWDEVFNRMLEVCRPGKTAADLRRACNGIGLVPERYVAHGIGMGFQPPIVGTYLGEAVEERYELKPDMVLVLEPYTWREGVGGFQAKQMVHITADGPKVWGQFPMGPLAGEDRIVQFPVAVKP